MDSTSLFTSRKGLILLLLFASLSFTVIGAEAQSNNGTSTSPPTNSTAPPPTNSTATPDPTDVGNFEPDTSSFIIDQFSNSTGTYISLINGDTIRTHFGNGTAVPSEQMGGEVVEVEEETEITTVSHTDVLPDPQPPVTPEIFIQPTAENEPHPNNPDGLPARDLINERSFDSEIQETKLPDGTILGTYTSGMTPMLLDYIDENEEEVWTFFKTSYSDGGIFGGETMTVSSPKTSYVYHYPTGSITLFTAGQVESGSQPVAVESWTIHQALWGTDTWTQLELNNAPVTTVIKEDADGITISAIRETADGVFTIDYHLGAGEELETFISFTNNNPAWDGVPNMEAKSQLVTPAIPFRAGIPEVPAVPSFTHINNGTVVPAIPAIPAVPEQQGVAAVYSEPSWILSGQPYKFGFVQSIDSITLTTDEYVGYTEHTDVSNVLTFVDHLGIDVKYDFKDSKSELWSVNVDENGLISMDFRYAKGVVNYGETKGIDPSWEWTTTSNSYYADAQGHGKSDVTTTVDAPTRCPDGTGDGAVGTADYTGQGRIAEHPTTQTDPSCSFEAIEFDVSGLPDDAVITAKDLIFDVDMVIPAATPLGWTASPSIGSGYTYSDVIHAEEGTNDHTWDYLAYYQITELDYYDKISHCVANIYSAPTDLKLICGIWSDGADTGGTTNRPHILLAQSDEFDFWNEVGDGDSTTWDTGAVGVIPLTSLAEVGASGNIWMAILPDRDATNWHDDVFGGSDYAYSMHASGVWDDTDFPNLPDPAEYAAEGTIRPAWGYKTTIGSAIQGDKITIDVDTAIATYDNPTDVDWQRKALTSALDESTCDSESPCGFKATAEINVSALGDGTQVVVLQDDTDAPQESTTQSSTSYGEPNSDYDGTNDGADTGQTGKFGYAWNFGGNDGNNSGEHDHVDADGLAGNTDAGATIKSISVWAKQNNNGNTHNDGWIMSWGNNNAAQNADEHFVIKDAWGDLEVGIRDGGSGTMWEGRQSGIFLDHQWHHIVVTTDGTEAKFYLDGTNIPSSGWGNTNDLTAWIDSDHNKYTIGSSAGHYIPNYINAKTFDGSIDQLLIYSDELDQDAVDLLWNSGNGDTTPDGGNLIAHYDFEQTSGTLENVAIPETTVIYEQLDSEDGLALTVDAEGNAKISARDPAVAPTSSYNPILLQSDFGNNADGWEMGSGFSLDTANARVNFTTLTSGEGVLQHEILEGTTGSWKLHVTQNLSFSDSSSRWGYGVGNEAFSDGNNKGHYPSGDEDMAIWIETNSAWNEWQVIVPDRQLTYGSITPSGTYYIEAIYLEGIGTTVYWYGSESDRASGTNGVGHPANKQNNAPEDIDEILNSGVPNYITHFAVARSDNTGNGASGWIKDITITELNDDGSEATAPATNDGDWSHSDAAHTLDVGTDYVAEITRGNIEAGADEAIVVTAGSDPQNDWTFEGSSVTIANEQVEATPLQLSGEDRIWREITTVSDTQWVMDCDFEASNLSTNNPAFVFCGLSSENHISGYSSPDADVIAMQMNDNSGTKLVQVITYNDGSYVDEKPNNLTVSEDTPYFVRLIRDGNDFTMSVHTSDSGRTNNSDHITNSPQTWTGSSLSNIVGLDHVVSGSGNWGNSGWTWEYTADNFKLWDGVTSPTGSTHFNFDFAASPAIYVDPKDVATLRILDDGNQVGSTVHLDVSDIQGLDNVFLAGAIPDEAGHDSTTKDINIYGAGVTVTTSTTGDVPDTPDHNSDTFAAWGCTNNGGTQITESNHVLTFDITERSNNHTCSTDLGASLTDQWVLRFKTMFTELSHSSAGIYFLVGFGDDSHSTIFNNSGITQDGLLFKLYVHGSTNPNDYDWGVVTYTDENSSTGLRDCKGNNDLHDCYIPPPTDDGTPYYVEMIRTSANQVTLGIYDSSDYDTLISGSSVVTWTPSALSSVDNLRYLKVGTNEYVAGSSASGVIEGTAQDFQIWDGVTTVPTSSVTTYTDVTTYPTTPAWQSEFDNAVANGRNCDVVELGIQPSAQTEYNALYTGIKDGADVLIENNDFCARNGDETISVATSYNEKMTEDYYAIGIRHDNLGVKLTDESSSTVTGKAWDFDGTDDYVQLASMTDTMTTTGSIVTWVNFDQLVGNECIWSFADDDVQSYLKLCHDDSTGKLHAYLKINDSGVWLFYSASDAVSTTGWYHLALVQDGSAVILYVNGVESDSGGTNGSEWVTSSFDQFTLGARDYGDNGAQPPAGFNDMQLDDFAVFDRALTQAEVTSLQTNAVSSLSNQAGLVAYFDFEQDGSTLEDKSGNDHDGTAYSMESDNRVTGTVDSTTITPATYSDRDSNHWHADVEAELEITYTIPPPFLPNAPTGFEQDVSNLQQGEVDLVWTDPTEITEEIPVDQYNIYKSEFVYAKRQLADNQGTDPFLFNICGQSGDASCQQDMSDNTLLMHLNNMFTTVSGVTTSAFDVTNLLAYYNFDEDATFTYDPLDFVQNEPVPSSQTESMGYQIGDSVYRNEVLDVTDTYISCGGMQNYKNNCHDNIKGGYWSPDGYKMYLLAGVDWQNDDPVEITFATAWDIESAHTIDFILESCYNCDQYGWHFTPDGEQLILLFTDHTMKAYEMTTGWDFSTLNETPVWTLSNVHQLDGANLSNTGMGMFFNQDGTKLYMTEWNGTLHEWDGLSSDYFVGTSTPTANYVGSQVDICSSTYKCNQVVIHPTDNTKFWVGSNGDTSYPAVEWEMTTGGDYSTATATGVAHDGSAEEDRPTMIWFGDDGKILYQYNKGTHQNDVETAEGQDGNIFAYDVVADVTTTTYGSNPDAWITGIDSAAFDTQEEQSPFTPASPTPLLNENFDDDTGWTLTGNSITGGVLEWEIDPSDKAVYDLGTVSDTSWVLRWKHTVDSTSYSTSTDFGWIGLSTYAGSKSATQDFLGFTINPYSNYPYDLQLQSRDGQALGLGTGDPYDCNEGGSYDDNCLAQNTWANGGTWYYEMVRDGSDLTLKVFSDEYSTQVGYTLEQAIGGTVSGLQYLIFVGDDSRSDAGTGISGEADDIIFFDGVTACNPCADTPAVIYDSNLTTSASPVDWGNDDWTVSAWTKQSEAGLPISADGWKFGQATGAYGTTTVQTISPDFFSDDITWTTYANSEVTTDTPDGVNGLRSYCTDGGSPDCSGGYDNTAKGVLTDTITNDESKLFVFDYDFKRSSNEVSDGRYQFLILSSEDVSDGYGDPASNYKQIVFGTGDGKSSVWYKVRDGGGSMSEFAGDGSGQMTTLPANDDTWNYYRMVIDESKGGYDYYLFSSSADRDNMTNAVDEIHATQIDTWWDSDQDANPLEFIYLALPSTYSGEHLDSTYDNFKIWTGVDNPKQSVTADATRAGVELDGTFYPSDVTSSNWVHHALTKETVASDRTPNFHEPFDEVGDWVFSGSGGNSAFTDGGTETSHFNQQGSEYAKLYNLSLADATTSGEMVVDFDWKREQSTVDSPYIILTSYDQTTGCYGDPDNENKKIQFQMGGHYGVKASIRVGNGAGNSGWGEINPAITTVPAQSTIFYYRMVMDHPNVVFSYYASAEDRANSGQTATVSGDSNVATVSATNVPSGWTLTNDLNQVCIGFYDANGYNHQTYDMKVWAGTTDPTSLAQVPTTNYYANGVLQQTLTNVAYGDETVPVTVSGAVAPVGTESSGDTEWTNEDSCGSFSCASISGNRVTSNGDWYTDHANSRTLVEWVVGESEFSATYNTSGDSYQKIGIAQDAPNPPSGYEGWELGSYQYGTGHYPSIGAGADGYFHYNIDYQWDMQDPSENNVKPLEPCNEWVLGQHQALHCDNEGTNGGGANGQFGTPAWDSSTLFRLDMDLDGVVTYYIDDDLKYTSAMPAPQGNTFYMHTGGNNAGGTTWSEGVWTKTDYVSTAGFDAQIDDVVIFDEAITVFAVETLYNQGNHRAPSSLQNPSYASHWELDGVGTDAEKLASGIVNAQPLPNPNTSTETVLKNVDVGQPVADGVVTVSCNNCYDDELRANNNYRVGMDINSGSALNGKVITSVSFDLKAVNSPSGTGYARVYDDSNVMVHEFGSIDLSTLTGSYVSYPFNTGTYTLDTDYKLVFDIGGSTTDSTDKVNMQINSPDRYDGTNTHSIRYNGGWIDTTDQDPNTVVLTVGQLSDLDGTWANDPTAGVAGISGTAYSMDGSNDYVELDAIQSAMTTTGSISMWFYVPSSYTDDDKLWAFGDTDGNEFFFVEFENGDSNSDYLDIKYRVAGSTVWQGNTGTDSIVADTWYHFVITHDGAEPKFYLNGSDETNLANTNDQTAWISAGTGLDNFRLGTIKENNNAETEFGKFYADEASFWSDALSAEEVAVLYSNKNLQDLPTVTTGTATTTVGIADSSGVHEIGGQLTLGTQQSTGICGTDCDLIVETAPESTIGTGNKASPSGLGTYSWDADGDYLRSDGDQSGGGSSTDSSGKLFPTDSSFTFTAWVNWDSFGGETLLDKRDPSGNEGGVKMAIRDSGAKMQFSVSVPDYSDTCGFESSYSGGFDTDKWYLLIGTFDDTTGTCTGYAWDADTAPAEPVEINSNSNSGAFNPTADDYTLLSYQGNDSIDGRVMEVAVWDKILSDAEIDTLFGCDTTCGTGVPANTVATSNVYAYWDGTDVSNPVENMVYEVQTIVAGGDFEAGKLSNALIDPTLIIESSVLPSETDDFTIMGWVKQDGIPYAAESSVTTYSTSDAVHVGSTGDNHNWNYGAFYQVGDHDSNTVNAGDRVSHCLFNVQSTPSGAKFVCGIWADGVDTGGTANTPTTLLASGQLDFAYTGGSSWSTEATGEIELDNVAVIGASGKFWIMVLPDNNSVTWHDEVHGGSYYYQSLHASGVWDDDDYPNLPDPAQWAAAGSIEPSYGYKLQEVTTVTIPEQPYVPAEDSWLYSYPNTDGQYSVIQVGATTTKLGITEDVDVTTSSTVDCLADDPPTACFGTPNWDTSDTSHYTISTTTTTDDTVEAIGSANANEAYDSVAVSTSDTNDIEFQLNDVTFYTATGEAQSQLDGYYAIFQAYYGGTCGAKFVATDEGAKYTWTLTNGVAFACQGMDTHIGLASATDPSFESFEWMINFGDRGGSDLIEIWEGGSSNIPYSQAHTLSDGDTISIVYNSGATAQVSTTVTEKQLANPLIEDTHADVSDEWHHYAYTREGTDIAIYLDGVEIQSETILTTEGFGEPITVYADNKSDVTPTSATADLRYVKFASWYTQNAGYLKGTIDNLEIWDGTTDTSGTPDFTDDFSSDNLSATGSDYTVSGGVLNFDSDNNAQHEAATLDIGSSLDDSQWVMRYEITTTQKNVVSDDSHVFIGISNYNDGWHMNDDQDMLGAMFGSGDESSGEGFTSFIDGDWDNQGGGTATPDDVSFEWDVSTPKTYYVEMKRTSATEFSTEVFTSNTWTADITATPTYYIGEEVGLEESSTIVTNNYKSHNPAPIDASEWDWYGTSSAASNPSVTINNSVAGCDGGTIESDVIEESCFLYWATGSGGVSQSGNEYWIHELAEAASDDWVLEWTSYTNSNCAGQGGWIKIGMGDGTEVYYGGDGSVGANLHYFKKEHYDYSAYATGGGTWQNEGYSGANQGGCDHSWYHRMVSDGTNIAWTVWADKAKTSQEWTTTMPVVAPNPTEIVINTYAHTSYYGYNRISEITFCEDATTADCTAFGSVTTTTTSTPANALDGALDEIATFDVALSADEIYNAYQRGAETFALVGTVAYDDADTIGEFTETGLGVNEAPVYQLGAENLLGETMSETILPAITAVPPDAPTSVVAVAVAGQINVSWQAPSFDGGSTIIDYVVYRTDNPTTIVHTTTGTSWSGDTSGVDGVGYTYKAHARNVMGEGDAGTSNTEVAGNVPAQAAIATMLALAGLGIRLDWTHQNNGGYGLTSYTVEWTSDGGSNWNAAGTTAGSATTFTHSGLTEGTDYQYQLRATNALGDGAWSSMSSAVTAGDVPDAPSSVSSTANAGSSITTTWTAPDDHEYAIDKYEIFRDGVSIDANVTVLTYTDSSLTDGTTYVYKVRAHNQLGWSVDSATSSAVAGDIPDQVTGLSATAAVDYDVDLAWSAAGDNGHTITNYLIEHSADGSTNWTTKATVANVLTYHAEYDSAESGNTKYWRVSAINDLGTGAVSANASVKIGDVPSQVSGLTATAQSATEIDLAWNLPSDNGYSIATYKIERSGTGTFGGEETVLTSTHTTLTYSDTGLTTSTDYYYRVSATNALGEGAYSSTVTEKTFGVPSDITDLALTVISTSQIDLTWTQPALNGYSLVEYEIFRSEDGTNYTSIATQTGTSYSSTGLNANDLYYYKVTTTNGFGTSGDSNIEFEPTLPTPPATVTLTVNSATQITVQWNQPAGDQQTSYKIERSLDGTNWSDLVASTGNTNTSHVDTGLTTLTTYYYKVSTINPSGTSVASTASNAETWGVPDAPTNLTAVAVLNVDIDLDWDAPADTHGQPIIGYKIERGITNTSFSVIVTDTGNTDTDYTDADANLVAGTEYFYRVSAINSQGTGDPSGVASATAADVPAVVTGLAITSSATNSVDLDWTAPSANGSPITGYKIEKSTDGTTYNVLVADTQNTNVTYNDDDGGNGLNVNTLYYYKVSAINAFGTGDSDSANGATLPQAPSSVTLTVISDVEITVAWANPVGDAETGFMIEQSTDGTNWSTIVADTGNTNLTYSNTGLTALTEYHYRISTINVSGTSAASTSASDTTFGAPDSPTNLTATSLIGAEIKLDWTAPSNDNGAAVSGYKIERSTDNVSFSVLVADTQSTAVTYTDSGLTTGTTYYYKISAINTFGAGTASSVASALASDVPAQVANLTATEQAGKEIDLAWSAPNNGGSAITGYKIERSTDGTNYSDLVASTGNQAVTYSDINLTIGTTYYYKVSAINLVGTGTASTAASTVAGDRPAQITVISATAAAGQEILVAWTAPADNSYAISSYLIQVSTDQQNWTTAGSSTTTTFTDTGLAIGSTYYYRAHATNSLGDSDKSAIVNALAGDVPAQTSGLTTTVLSDTQIRLNWTAPVDNAYSISGYKIERSADNTNWSVLIADTQSTAVVHTDSGLTPKTDYYYRISAINSLGTGTASTSVIGTTWDVPDAIADLSGSVSGSDIVLTWSAPANNGATISKYIFQVQSVDTGNWITLDNNVQALTATHSGISTAIPNTQISYRVYAVNAIGQSPASNVEAVWTLPTAPTGVTVTATSDTEIDVTWTTIAGLTYELEHADTAVNPQWTSEANPATTPYSDTGLTLGTYHQYRVFAVNPSGTSPASATASATTFYYPTPPLNVAVNSGATLLDATISWTAPADNGGTPITEYKIERSITSASSGFNPITTTTSLSYDDTGLAQQTQYWYRVLAVNSVGADQTNGYSTVVTYTTPTPPSSPSNLSVLPLGTTNSAAKLDWQAPSNTGSHPISGYKIERNINSGGWSTAVETTNALTSITDTNLVVGNVYDYRVFAITSAGYSANPTNTHSIEMLDITFTITAGAIGGNTVQIIPTLTLNAGDPLPIITKIRIYESGAFAQSHDLNEVFSNTGTFWTSTYYEYPTVESSYFAIATIESAAVATTQWTSNTVIVTPAAPFAGELNFEEIRDVTSNWSESQLNIDIQPAGSDVLIKYQPEGNVKLNTVTGICEANCPIITGYQNVQQTINATSTNLDPNKNYYISIYIQPTFPEVSYGTNNGDNVAIACTAESSPNCQEGNIPKAYASNVALKSTASIYAPPSVGIDQLGNLFGLPLVFVFVIGIAAIFTGRSAQMGIIFIAVTLGIMAYLGYISFDFDPENNSNIITWTLIIIVAVLGAFIGKRWS